MIKYRLSNIAKEDLIEIHQYGLLKFGEKQADLYYNTLFEYFDIISKAPESFESVDFIKQGYRRCVCGSNSIYYTIDKEFGIINIMTIVGRQNIFNKKKDWKTK